jgi:hypothetical protein
MSYQVLVTLNFPSEQKIFTRSDDCAALYKFIVRIFTTKIEKLQMRGNKSV